MGARADRVHLTRDGYGMLASSLAAELLRAYDGWKAEAQRAKPEPAKPAAKNP
jgi:hypothetical protein